MWFERFVIIVVGLHRDFLPSGWGMFYPTVFDIGILIGVFGLFFTLFLLFIRALPMIAMWEIKGWWPRRVGWRRLPGRQLLVASFATASCCAPVADAAGARASRSTTCSRPTRSTGSTQAMGIRRSRLPFVTLLAGLGGLCFALAFQYYTAVFDWPLDVGGKPENSTLAFVPICFELTVLIGGLGTVGRVLPARAALSRASASSCPCSA